MRANFLRQMLWALSWIVLLLPGGVIGAEEPSPAKPEIDRDRAERGKALFERSWDENDSLTPQGDGLGPMRNANSCVECHRQGGVGGGGPAHRNVQLLTVKLTKKDVDEGRVFRGTPFIKRLTNVHANFVTASGFPQATVVFHRFGPDHGYDAWRDTFWGVPQTLVGPPRLRAVKSAHERRDGKPVTELEHDSGFRFLLSERNTPAMFGADEIDRIPADVIRSRASFQAQYHPGITGRAVRTARPLTEAERAKLAQDQAAGQFVFLPGRGNQDQVEDVGRFGWRGQTTSLRDFVLGACAVELGLSAPGQVQASDPRMFSKEGQKRRGLDLTLEQCDEMVEYVRSLPRPQQVKPTDGALAESVVRGERLFSAVGCAVCHSPKMGDVDGLYSDLLLHDLGEELADPMPAPDGTVSVSAEYYGPSFQIPPDPILVREWRTPPLWGVADSAPYLHAGRAATFEQAIVAHGGEATSSVQQFKLLNEADRGHVLAFLNTLRAPGQVDPVLPPRKRPLAPPPQRVAVQTLFGNGR